MPKKFQWRRSIVNEQKAASQKRRAEVKARLQAKVLRLSSQINNIEYSNSQLELQLQSLQQVILKQTREVQSVVSRSDNSGQSHAHDTAVTTTNIPEFEFTIRVDKRTDTNQGAILASATQVGNAIDLTFGTNADASSATAANEEAPPALNFPGDAPGAFDVAFSDSTVRYFKLYKAQADSLDFNLDLSAEDNGKINLVWDDSLAAKLSGFTCLLDGVDLKTAGTKTYDFASPAVDKTVTVQIREEAAVVINEPTSVTVSAVVSKLDGSTGEDLTNVIEGETVVLTATVAGDNLGTLTYLWKEGSTPITDANTHVYTISSDVVGNKIYTVEVTNSEGNKTAQVTVTVSAAPDSNVITVDVFDTTYTVNPTGALLRGILKDGPDLFNSDYTVGAYTPDESALLGAGQVSANGEMNFYVYGSIETPQFILKVRKTSDKTEQAILGTFTFDFRSANGQAMSAYDPVNFDTNKEYNTQVVAKPRPTWTSAYTVTYNVTVNDGKTVPANTVLYTATVSETDWDGEWDLDDGDPPGNLMDVGHFKTTGEIKLKSNSVLTQFKINMKPIGKEGGIYDDGDIKQITIDIADKATSKPTLSVSPSSVTVGTQVTFTGTAEADSSVQLYKGSDSVGTPVTANISGNFSIDFTPSAAEAATYTVKATDTNTNESVDSDSVSLTVTAADTGGGDTGGDVTQTIELKTGLNLVSIYAGPPTLDLTFTGTGDGDITEILVWEGDKQSYRIRNTANANSFFSFDNGVTEFLPMGYFMRCNTDVVKTFSGSLIERSITIYGGYSLISPGPEDIIIRDNFDSATFWGEDPQILEILVWDDTAKTYTIRNTANANSFFQFDNGVTTLEKGRGYFILRPLNATTISI